MQPTEEARRWGHYLLIRRSLSKPDELAYYVVHAPRNWVSLETLVQVAGHRWKIEQGFQTAKGECGLEEYEVSRWASWHRHITLSLLAHALLAAIRQASQHQKNRCRQGPVDTIRAKTANKEVAMARTAGLVPCA
ncbi:hypothetical protein HVA01_33100 [Halovibrio variabilis]|uniref:Transposase IS4-like domain-containing protein n=1 Tax=Halovibrio variabilis TaxID=31910 RepID=A0A511USU7_9GAMM|nr:hypothetical protein HVA01_33100 [Halovibrio variabilis]